VRTAYIILRFTGKMVSAMRFVAKTRDLLIKLSAMMAIFLMAMDAIKTAEKNSTLSALKIPIKKVFVEITEHLLLASKYLKNNHLSFNLNLTKSPRTFQSSTF